MILCAEHGIEVGYRGVYKYKITCYSFIVRGGQAKKHWTN